MIKTIMKLFPILLLGFVPIANAYSQAYLFGYKYGLEDGKGTIYDGNTCASQYPNTGHTNEKNMTLYDRCMLGYDAGFKVANSTNSTQPSSTDGKILYVLLCKCD
jgi:hypothetical protein